jgi:hypothetical protein
VEESTFDVRNSPRGVVTLLGRRLVVLMFLASLTAASERRELGISCR